MKFTTVRVDLETRRLLKRLAKSRGLSMRVLLRLLVEEEAKHREARPG